MLLLKQSGQQYVTFMIVLCHSVFKPDKYKLVLVVCVIADRYLVSRWSRAILRRSGPGKFCFTDLILALAANLKLACLCGTLVTANQRATGLQPSPSIRSCALKTFFLTSRQGFYSGLDRKNLRNGICAFFVRLSAQIGSIQEIGVACACIVRPRRTV